jgi:DNA-binding sugar fermentation-stimulating protein
LNRRKEHGDSRTDYLYEKNGVKGYWIEIKGEKEA